VGQSRFFRECETCFQRPLPGPLPFGCHSQGLAKSLVKASDAKLAVLPEKHLWYGLDKKTLGRGSIVPLAVTV
jgi:hypothetical protein